MKKLNTLLRDTQMNRAGDAAAPAAPPRTHGTGHGDNGNGRDHVDAINQMFAEFELAYHNQFHKAYAREGSLAIAKKYWLGCLQSYPPEVLLQATRKVVAAQTYLPTLSSIAQACENAGDLFGLPDVHAAYIEACLAPEPKHAQRWSHPAVYLAGRDADWFVLANQPESVSYPLFEHHYQQYCRRVMEGDELAAPNPPALSSDNAKPLSDKENQARLRKLRQSLKL